MDLQFTQVNSREFKVFVDNLKRLLIKSYEKYAFSQASNDVALAHFCIFSQLLSMKRFFDIHSFFSRKLYLQ
mgnify:CR=1 FL=1